MRAALLLALAGCWTAPVPAAKPTPVAEPVPQKPSDAELVTAQPIDKLEGDEIVSADGEVQAVGPWKSIRTGWHASEFVLEVDVDGTLYSVGLAGGVDGALTPVLRLADVLPGRPPELVIAVEHITDGGKSFSTVVCGVGASKKPSCATWDIRRPFDLRDEIDVKTPKQGGVNVTWDGQTQKLWFAFP